MTIFRYALKRSFSNRTNMLFLLLPPLACIFLPAGEPWPFLPYGYQYFGIFLMFLGVRLATIVLEDRASGMVKRLAVAPIGHFQYFSQNVLAFALILVAQCAILVYGGVLYGQELYRPFHLLILYISFNFASLAVAMAWISMYRRKDTAFLVYMSLVFLMAVLGGLLLPLQMFPEILKRVAVVLPTYWLSEGLNWIAFGEAEIDFWLVNGVLWLYTAVFMIIGSKRKIY